MITKHEKHFHHNQERRYSLCAGSSSAGTRQSSKNMQSGRRRGKNTVIATQRSLYFGPKISKTIIFYAKVPRKFNKVSLHKINIQKSIPYIDLRINKHIYNSNENYIYVYIYMQRENPYNSMYQYTNNTLDIQQCTVQTLNTYVCVLKYITKC